MDIINNELFNQKNIIDEKADKFAKKEVELKDRSNDRSVLTSSMSGYYIISFKLVCPPVRFCIEKSTA